MRNRRAIVRIVAVALLLYALASLIAVRRELNTVQALQQSLAEELAQLQQEQALLEEKLAAFGEDAEMRRLAWERLRMVMPEDTVYYFTDEAG